MTEQEAIQGIKNEMECVLSEHSTSYFDECLEVAYASMEKQIAKKPNTEPFYGGRCAVCNNLIPNKTVKYCSMCGQKILLDWGNEDAE